MKVIYVASPYSGDVTQNTYLARMYCRYVVDKGYVPFASHLLLPQFMSESKERDLAFEMNVAFLEKCDELWVFGEKISKGMALEIRQAEKLNKKICFINEIV